MENERLLLLSVFLVIFISFSADLFIPSDAKFSLSSIKEELVFGKRHSAAFSDPCEAYGDGHSLPYGHPCSKAIYSHRAARVIPRLIGLLRKGVSNGGGHPPGSGHHPPGTGKLPPGIGHHPPGVGHRPPRFDGDPRCRHNKSLCLDPNRNPFLKTDATKTTCCRTKCVSLVTNPKHCGRCGKRCRSQTDAGPNCCSQTCVNIKTDNNNCGACGVLCKSSETCIAGVCIPYV